MNARTVAQTAADDEVLRWIGRFRFVTATVLAERFAVSVQAMRSRLRRMENASLVRRSPPRPGYHTAVYLAPAGARRIGSNRHVAPRFDTHERHESALSELVCELEMNAPAGVSIWTERDCRDLENHGQGRFSVDVNDGRGRLSKRWPDAVIEHASRIVVLEVEFAPKGSDRLRHIIDGYLHSRFDEARFLVEDPALARRLLHIAKQQSAGLAAFNSSVCAITIRPWQGVDAATAAAIRRATGD